MTNRKPCCVIGAGYGGLGGAKVLKDAGFPYDHLERSDRVGGNWAHAVYDSAHLITSKKDTAYVGYPMPDDYPMFPARAQMLAYLEDFAERAGLREHIEFGTEVVSCKPIDSRGLEGWRVELASGEEREYGSVVVANGHFWEKRMPAYPGEFAGQMIHSGDYRRAEDLEGPRVLVVGGGSSGTDLVAEAAEIFGHADISLRQGYWHSPKSFLGISISEFDKPWLPESLQALGGRLVVRTVFGRYEQYGLDHPNHGFFDRDPTVSSRFIPALANGRVTRRREIARYEGKTVHFVDGTSREYDTILWATGYNISFPFLDRDLFEWERGKPKLYGRMLPPGLANMVVWGLIDAHAGAGKLMDDSGNAFVEVLQAQERLDVPFTDLLEGKLEAKSSTVVGLYDFYREMRLIRRVARRALGQPLRGGRLGTLVPSPAKVRAIR